MDIVQFRTNFPEFSDIARYPDGQITFWSSVAELNVSTTIWGDMRPNAVYLYTAHEIVLAAQAAKAGVVGGVPGTMSGPINSKTVGSVSVAYDTTSSAEKDAGYWNLTTYGKQYIRLSRLYGGGGRQL